MITLTKNPRLIEYYLEELSQDLHSGCWEAQHTMLNPLKRCAELLQPFHVTQRGRAILANLHQVIGRMEGMVAYWETKSNEIAQTLRDEREYKAHEEPIAIG